MNNNDALASAWAVLEQAAVDYEGKPVGIIASVDDEQAETLNYNQVFVRDFFVSALALLTKGRSEPIRNFLLVCTELQSQVDDYSGFRPGRGLMPASFLVNEQGRLAADFGEKAIGRVTPTDSGLWWLILLRVYVKATDDTDILARKEIRQAVHLILELVTFTWVDTFPTLLVSDGSFMIDRRLGVYGYPLEIQVLLYGALRASHELFPDDEVLQKQAQHKLGELQVFIREFYWLTPDRLNQIYRFEKNAFGCRMVHDLNIQPNSIPKWLYEWLPDACGYFVGNVGPARMDFRVFMQGNLMAILFGLMDDKQAKMFLNLVEKRWDDLVGRMPLKLVYPAVEGRDWEILTSFDPKNIPWSYHNGGHWPFLLWSYTAACIGHDQLDKAQEAIKLARPRLLEDRWPEYYDGINGRLLGKEARRKQTWSAAGFVLLRKR